MNSVIKLAFFFSSLLLIDTLSSSQSVGYNLFGASRLSLKHKDHKGIGYNDGYSTLVLYLSPRSSLPIINTFIDARAHIFNDSYFASNLGCGMRISSHESTYVVGVNLFYDSRWSREMSSHQVGGGFEILSRSVDFRINAYKPILGRYLDEQMSFSRFKNHFAYLKQKVTYALPMAEMELGFRLPDPFDQVGLYTAFGGYYLFKQTAFRGSSGDVFGGKLRVVASPTSFVSLGVEHSFDEIFKHRTNGFVSLNVPLGITPKRPRGVLKKKQIDWGLFQHQEVVRQEIIPYDKKTLEFLHKSSSKEPYRFLFVDNCSNHDEPKGSFESPYETIHQALNDSIEGDTIYVAPGSGVYESDMSLVMKNGVSLLSTQVDAEIGGITIEAAEGEGLSKIYSHKGAAIILDGVSNARISGFEIASENDQGLVVRNSSAEITNNILISAKESSAAYFENNSGKIVFNHNQIIAEKQSDLKAPLVLIKDVASPASNYEIGYNVFACSDGQSALKLEDTFSDLNLLYNTFVSQSPEGAAISIAASSSDPKASKYIIKNNAISSGFFEGVNILIENEAGLEIDLVNNSVESQTLIYGVNYKSESLTSDLTLIGNRLIGSEHPLKIDQTGIENRILIHQNEIYHGTESSAISIKTARDHHIEISNNTILYQGMLEENFSAVEIEVAEMLPITSQIVFENNEINTKVQNQALKIDYKQAHHLEDDSFIRAHGNTFDASEQQAISIEALEINSINLEIENNKFSIEKLQDQYQDSK
jgi:hypothetical protein